jgi:hypothetical protein
MDEGDLGTFLASFKLYVDLSVSSTDHPTEPQPLRLRSLEQFLPPTHAIRGVEPQLYVLDSQSRHQ